MVLNDKNECSYCDSNNQRYVKTKETKVKLWLDNSNIVYESYDKPIEGGVCIKSRPDFILDAGTHIVVLEVDENQHKGYPCECEQIRMVNISQAFGIATVFIRYNPDEFRDINNKKCDPSDIIRKNTLLEYIRFAMETIPSNFCEAIYLYYDGQAPHGVNRLPVLVQL
jgi:hypothetical protein